MENKKKTLKSWIFLLILIDQAIKIIINFKYINQVVTIIPSKIYFNPIFNRQYSMLNSILNLGISRLAHIVLIATTCILVYYLHEYISVNYGQCRAMNIAFVFILSGAICSLLDKVFWNGSLDYIYIKGYFIIDLKDIYVIISLFFSLIAILLEEKELPGIENFSFIDFFRYLKNKFKR